MKSTQLEEEGAQTWLLHLVNVVLDTNMVKQVPPPASMQLKDLYLSIRSYFSKIAQIFNLRAERELKLVTWNPALHNMTLLSSPILM